MTKVVFTGPAFDSFGRSILRDNLVEACMSAGITVQLSIRPDTDVLVASRADTVKAKKAVAQGIKVMTYPEFITRELEGLQIDTDGTPNPFTDKVDPDLLVPDFAGMAQLELLDQL